MTASAYRAIDIPPAGPGLKILEHLFQQYRYMTELT
jgi:hypothetical protein